jgi:xylulokinase
MPVEIIEAEEGAAYGAALLAGVGAGVWSSVDQACDSTVKVAERIEPDRDRAARMNCQYTTYQRLYPALREIFRELKS